MLASPLVPTVKTPGDPDGWPHCPDGKSKLETEGAADGGVDSTVKANMPLVPEFRPEDLSPLGMTLVVYTSNS